MAGAKPHVPQTSGAMLWRGWVPCSLPGEALAWPGGGLAEDPQPKGLPGPPESAALPPS